MVLLTLHFKEIHRMVKSSQVAASEHTLHHQNDIQHGLFKIRFSISFHSDSAAGVLTSHEVKQESCLVGSKTWNNFSWLYDCNEYAVANRNIVSTPIYIDFKSNHPDFIPRKKIQCIKLYPSKSI